MTANQINYWRLSEDKRHNIVSEGETFRHNVATEGETARANRAKEYENYRSNTARELETHRSNVANEEIKTNTLFETIRSNKVREQETQTHNRATEAANVEANRIAAQQANLAATKYADVREATKAKANVDVAIAEKEYELKQAQIRDTVASSVSKEASTVKSWTGAFSDLSSALFGRQGIVGGVAGLIG